MILSEPCLTTQQESHGGRRELTPTGHTLASAHTSKHTWPHICVLKCNKKQEAEK